MCFSCVYMCYSCGAMCSSNGALYNNVLQLMVQCVKASGAICVPVGVTGVVSVLQAYSCMEEMKVKIPKVNLAYYINVKTIETVHKALDVPLSKSMNGVHLSNGVEEENGEMVDEDVIDDYSPDS